MEYHDCRKCNKTYEELPTDKKSNAPEKYLKAHLGFCGIKCWNQLSDQDKAREKMILAVHGRTRKDNNFKV